MKQILQRVSGLIVGAASAYACLNVPLVQIEVFISESEWHKTHPLSYFDIVLWVRDSSTLGRSVTRPVQPITVPKGTKLVVVGHHDNSAGNKFNPNPNKDVYYGKQAWEEMMSPWFGLVVPKDVDPKTVLRMAGQVAGGG